jgi:hypothetical protein
LPAGRDSRLQAGHVIAEGFTKAAGLEEIALHVDDHQRSAVKIDGKRRRFSLESHAWHVGPLASHRQEMCKNRASMARTGKSARRGGRLND